MVYTSGMKQALSIQTVHWFRRDLRVTDNPGLFHAVEKGAPTAGVFIFDEKIIKKFGDKDPRFGFLYQSIEALRVELESLGIPLLCLRGRPEECWERWIDLYRPKQVTWNRDYEPGSRTRDKKITRLLTARGIQVESYSDHVIFEPEEILTKQGTSYKVFTPYSKSWIKALEENPPRSFPRPPGQPKKTPRLPPLEQLGLSPDPLRPKPYRLEKLAFYFQKKDWPAEEGTTWLGPYLRFGIMGIRQLIEQLESGDEIFLRQLIWREFFQQILFHFPWVEEESFREKYRNLPWLNRGRDWEAWKTGNTGFDLVDAGMRQLNETGYMHNRIRMICASFLCKDLLIDWRWGERYFAQKLFDYELASNNGNWQWAAGTGCDAAPYFRVFHPESQRKKYDPDGEYVKRWLPERKPGAVSPIVDHRLARLRALEFYQKTRQ